MTLERPAKTKFSRNGLVTEASVVVVPSMPQLCYASQVRDLLLLVVNLEPCQQNQHALRRERRSNVIGGTEHGLTTLERCQVTTGAMATERHNSTISLVGL
jgi:hypothetical protein